MPELVGFNEEQMKIIQSYRSRERGLEVDLEIKRLMIIDLQNENERLRAALKGVREIADEYYNFGLVGFEAEYNAIDEALKDGEK